MMKKYSLVFFLLALVFNCKTQSKIANKNTFSFFSRQSQYNFENCNNNCNKWIEKENDTIIYTKYFKGSPCDLPDPNLMNIKIIRDTLFFDFGRIYDPNCERKIGVGGILVDFVLNKNDFPNYKNLVIKYVNNFP